MRIKKKYIYFIGNVISVLLIVYLFFKVEYMDNEIKILKKNNLQQFYTEKVLDDYNSDIFMSKTSISMDIIACGIAVFTLYGGFLSLINLKQSAELKKTMRKAKKALRNQKELSSSRFLQEGQLYRTWHRPHYAKESYELAVKYGKNTFSALVAKYSLITMYADVLSYKEKGIEDIEKQFKQYINELEKGKHYYRGRKCLKADSYFTLGCIYANWFLECTDANKKGKYSDKACEMFEKSIKEDNTNPDTYRNYAAHLSAINDFKSCKVNLNLANECAKKDDIYAELMAPERLVDLFKLKGKRDEDEAKKLLSKILS